MRKFYDPDFHKDEYERLAEKQLTCEQIFDGKILRVMRDIVELPGGHSASRERIEHIGAVCVLPVTDDGMACVERQFRYPLGQVITEIPAGKLDSADENRLDAAKRELREETGLVAGEWIDMGLFYPAAAYSDEVITMYLARDLKQETQSLDPDEFLDVKMVPMKELIKDVMEGRVPDAKTQTAVLKAARILGL